MPSKFTGFDGKLAEFNEKYKVNFSFEKHESQSLLEEDLPELLVNQQKSFTEPNLAYHNSLLSIYRDCVENMIDKKYESFDPAALIQDFDALMSDYRDYCNSKEKPAPESLGGSATDRDILNLMKSAISTMVSPNLVKHTERNYKSGDLSIQTMRTFLKQFENRNRGDNLTEEEDRKINLYAFALENIVNARTFRTRINPFNWLRMHRENKALELANALVSKFQSYAYMSEDDFALPEKKIAEKAVDKAKSASYSRESAANRAKRLQQHNEEQQQNKEQQQSIEQNKQHQNLEGSNPDRERVPLPQLSENKPNEEVVPMIKEENNLSQEKKLDSSNIVV